MALQVWLPLDGNLNNQGLNGVECSSILGTVSYTAGKIGQALSCNGSTYCVYNGINLGSEATISWFSRTTTNAKVSWVLYTDDISYGLTVWESGIYTLNKGDGNNNPFKNGSDNVDVLHDGRWHHFALTFGNSSAKLYIDGTYAGTAANFRSPKSTNKSVYIGGGSNNTHTYDWNGALNDFRIYDHCLSQKEISELSQALILHYKMSVPSAPNENLFIGSTLESKYISGWPICSSTSWWKYVRYYNGSSSIHTFSDSGTNGVREDTVLLNSASNLGICFSRNASDIDLDPSSYYTISCEAKCTNISKVLCIGLSYLNTSDTWVWRGGTNPQSFTEADKWQRFTLTFRPDADTKYISYCFTVYGSTNGTDTFTIRKCKLEKGSVATGWTASPYDHDAYSDVSGYRRNGDSVSIDSVSSDSPRYDNSTIFNGRGYISVPTSVKVKDEITLSVWAYLDDWTTYCDSNSTNARFISCTQSGGWTFVNNSGKLVFYMGTGTSSNTYKTANASTTLANLSSGWHLFTGTYDGFSSKIYIDGVLDGSSTAYSTKTPIYYHSTNGVFIGAESGASATTPVATTGLFNGKLSDMRIYATALSAEKIKELYDTGAFVDNHQNLFCYEIVEDNSASPQIDKTGVFHSPEFTETTTVEIYEDELKSNQLIEI